jgi:hypothetical protein
LDSSFAGKIFIPALAKVSERFGESFDSVLGEISEGRIQLSVNASPHSIDANFRSLRYFLQLSEAKCGLNRILLFVWGWLHTPKTHFHRSKHLLFRGQTGQKESTS